ncbi:MAG: NAD(P)-dependent oxidoreductase [Candidatus Acidiferrum sp.]
METIHKSGFGDFIIGRDDLILVTGATGFIGSRLVEHLLDRGFRNLRCFGRPFGKMSKLQALAERGRGGARVELVRGNLLSGENCVAATKDAAVIFHLAAGTGEKSFPDAYMNSVVTTRNLLEASLRHGCLRRIVSASSFAVYTNRDNPRRGLLDEACPTETHSGQRDAYTFAKVKQDELVRDYGKRFGIPHVIVRPGYVYGPGKKAITGRIGIDSFGLFLHLGGSNSIPVTYVDNCAEAIALAGLVKGVDGEVFNIVDDDLPSSRQFLRQYKKNVKKFNSIYLPHAVSYSLCYLWERYSKWSEGQLPPVFSRGSWYTFWKKTNYSNKKLKERLNWTPRISTEEGMSRYFEACRIEGSDA